VKGVKGTIKSAKEISFLFKTAQKVPTRSLVALISKTSRGRGSEGRVAFIAGKRLGNAPKRSRAKRLMREAARKVDVPWQGVDVLFIAREQTATTPLDAVVQDMKSVLRRLAGGKG
jgi:ribonuclease P protein component